MTSDANATSWLITGANRGLGFGFVEKLSRRPDTVVYAGARNPSTATALQKLASENPNIHILKIESTSEEDVHAAAKKVEAISGSLDVLIANAGISRDYTKAVDIDKDSFMEHLAVNVVGPAILFKHMYPLLKKGKTKKYVAISGAASTITEMNPWPLTVYGSSKAALNFTVKKASQEYKDEGFIMLLVDPGLVDTDMGNAGAVAFGLEKILIELDESVEALLKLIDSATAKESGRFWKYDGQEVPW